jgi:hypothetical protein
MNDFDMHINQDGEFNNIWGWAESPWMLKLKEKSGL